MVINSFKLFPKHHTFLMILQPLCDEDLLQSKECPFYAAPDTSECFEMNLPESPSKKLIRDDGTIRPFYHPNDCLVYYGIGRRSKFYWRNCEQAKAGGAGIRFYFDRHAYENYGYVKTSQGDQCMFLRNPSSFKRGPAIFMTPCGAKGQLALQWVISENSLWYRMGKMKYCVPFEKNSVARVRKCRSMVLG